MGLFAKKKKPEDTPDFRKKKAEQIKDKRIRYITERQDESDSVIGKNGGFIVKDGVLSVYSEEKTLFSCTVTELSMSELLSLEGIILEGNDIVSGGKKRKIIAYYVYY